MSDFDNGFSLLHAKHLYGDDLADMPRCEVDGCNGMASEFVITWAADDPSAHFMYCDKHAADAGFCISCGDFYGGTEEFFRSGMHGLCCECLRNDDWSSDDDFDEEDEPL